VTNKTGSLPSRAATDSPRRNDALHKTLARNKWFRGDIRDRPRTRKTA